MTGLWLRAGLARRTRRSALVLPTFTQPKFICAGAIASGPTGTGVGVAVMVALGVTVAVGVAAVVMVGVIVIVGVAMLVDVIVT